MPSYLTKPPLNPFELSKNETSRLGYPRNVRILNVPKQLKFGIAPLSRNKVISTYFFKHLVCCTKPIHIILRKYDRSQVKTLKSDIIAYFLYLQDRLLQRDLGYDDIVECDRVNYPCYGPRFWDWLSESKVFNYGTLRSYSVLLYVYLNRFPWRILKLHEKLRNANLGLLKHKPKKGHFDYKMVSFKALDLWPLHNSIMKIGSLPEQQKHFNSSVYPSNRRWMTFLIQELKKCLNPYEIDFAVLELETLCNCASLPDQITFVLTFKDDYVNILDWSTLFLTIKAIRKHFYRNYKIKVKEFVDDYGFSIKFDFGHKSRYFEPFECCIRLDTSYVSTWSLVRFLSKCDNRFLEMTLILNYWASSIGFYKFQHFYGFSFVLMIVFALQQVSPPVFKSLGLICDYESCDRPEFPLEHCFLEDENLIGNSENTQTTGELVIEFFRYYCQFKFENYVISPRVGKTRNKFDYYNEVGGHFMSWISVEEPFEKQIDESIHCTKKSMNQFRNCLSTYLTDLNLSLTNYLQVLTNPEYFNLQSDIYKYNRRLNTVPIVDLNSLTTVSTSRIDFETNSKSTSIESNQVDVKVVDLPVHVKEDQLIDLSPLPTSSEPKAVEPTVLVDFTEIICEKTSTETQVKPSSPISLSREEVNESVEKCNEAEDEDQCRVM